MVASGSQDKRCTELDGKHPVPHVQHPSLSPSKQSWAIPDSRREKKATSGKMAAVLEMHGAARAACVPQGDAPETPACRHHQAPPGTTRHQLWPGSGWNSDPNAQIRLCGVFPWGH